MTAGDHRVSVTSCLDGRLGAAYPASRHDVELRVEVEDTGDLAAILDAESTRIFDTEPRCRKVVFAAPVDDLAAISAAETAGFRYVLDVELPDGGYLVDVSLLVREAEFVTRVDMDLDRVPQS